MLRLTLAAAALLTATFSAQAQSAWPNKPVKILVPTAAGGTADNTARMFAQYVSKTLGQQFYVENRGGAGNTLGIDSVVRSPADGYTLLLGAGTIAINHLIYKKLPYDVLRDLTPVTQMISLPNVLVVHPSQPMKTLADYIAAAKAAPGKVDYASAGIGSNLHMAMELLKFRTGIEVTHVPYKRRTGAAGHAGRPCDVDGVERGLRQAAYRRRQDSRAGRHFSQKKPCDAGRADHR
jgi:tripartite-type tricarboxylate transporter receptor subunit TctC